MDCPEEKYNGFWFRYFDLGESYKRIRRRICREKDEFLFLAAEYEKRIRILRQDPWEMLITFIISQNNNIPARTQKQQLNHRSRKNLRNHTPVHH